MELLKLQSGADFTHIPYKGAAPAVIDLLGGQVAAMFAGIPALQAHIKSGKLRALAVTSTTRSRELPTVPTIAESGYPGFEAMFWFAVFVPASTPKQIITALHGKIVTALHSPDVQRRLIEMGMEISASTPEQLNEYLKTETLKWEKVINAGRITID
jgi:tripartite-type tricarboxylate transporter receptor subunit TctC